MIKCATAAKTSSPPFHLLGSLAPLQASAFPLLPRYHTAHSPQILCLQFEFSQTFLCHSPTQQCSIRFVWLYFHKHFLLFILIHHVLFVVIQYLGHFSSGHLSRYRQDFQSRLFAANIACCSSLILGSSCTTLLTSYSSSSSVNIPDASAGMLGKGAGLSG